MSQKATQTNVKHAKVRLRHPIFFLIKAEVLGTMVILIGSSLLNDKEF